jgi:uncharacterized RmlC-like cupin family protein
MIDARWRGDGVKVVRAAALQAQRGPAGLGRVTAFDFTGTGGSQTWIGTAVLPPGHDSGAHHHGRQEVAIYVVQGRTEIRWGARLEHAAKLMPGDFAYFPPYVPHCELNLDPAATLTFLVVRSDNEKLNLDLDIVPVAEPAMVA